MPWLTDGQMNRQMNGQTPDNTERWYLSWAEAQSWANKLKLKAELKILQYTNIMVKYYCPSLRLTNVRKKSYILVYFWLISSNLIITANFLDVTIKINLSFKHNYKICLPEFVDNFHLDRLLIHQNKLHLKNPKIKAYIGKL